MNQDNQQSLTTALQSIIQPAVQRVGFWPTTPSHTKGEIVIKSRDAVHGALGESNGAGNQDISLLYHAIASMYEAVIDVLHQRIAVAYPRIESLSVVEECLCIRIHGGEEYYLVDLEEKLNDGVFAAKFGQLLGLTSPFDDNARKQFMADMELAQQCILDHYDQNSDWFDIDAARPVTKESA